MKYKAVNNFILVLCLCFNMFVIGSIANTVQFQQINSSIFSHFNDNAIMLYSKVGFTSKQQNKINSLDNIATSQFIYIENSTIQYRNSQKDLYGKGNYFPLDLVTVESIPSLKGSIPASKDEILISQQLADVLIKRQVISPNIIGETIILDDTNEYLYTIVGTYDSKVYYQEQSGSTSFTNGFISGDYTNDIPDINEQIQKINTQIAYSGDQYGKIKTYCWNGCDDDYKFYKEAGISGLINPDDSYLYGDQLKNAAYITVQNPDDVNTLLKKIVNLMPDIYIFSNDSIENNLKFTYIYILLIIIVTITINIFIYVPCYRHSKYI